ncbi:MAG: protein translocase subunit SecD [Phycisphaerales bacterium]
MRHLIRNGCFILALVILSVWAFMPPETKLRKGRDLAGGVSMVYTVRTEGEQDPKSTINRTIEALKNRVDPQGLYEIAMVAQGNDRIEITMPLPREEVKAARKVFEDRLEQLGRARLTESRLGTALQLPPEERARQLETFAAGSAIRKQRLEAAAGAYDAAKTARAQYDAETDQSKKDGMVEGVAKAEVTFQNAQKDALASSLSASDILKVVQASTRIRYVEDTQTGQKVSLPSPREVAESQLRAKYPDAKDEIDDLLHLHADYEKLRTTLDDPQDLIRMLKGAGVLSFRIAVQAGTFPEEDRVRQELRTGGPRAVQASDVRFYKINQIENWINTKAEADALAQDPSAARMIVGRLGYVVEVYNGEAYMLCYDTRGSRLTREEGSWTVASARQSFDDKGRMSIAFEMDAAGAVRLGALTREHVKEPMAVLLDDEVYTAPTLQSEISRSGQITGDFSKQEIDYIVRVLSGGALQAKLGSEPISIDSVGPQLGADNLNKGLHSGLVALVLVATFMIVYYFESGAIAVVALLINAILILGAMALGKAAFTMPGIAGVVLTFGQAVDSNVLIYERLREEFHRGADMKTAVRLAFSRALSPIMDGNVSNLIICVVLYYFGTQEIRGFAITLGIGVVTTLFTAIVVTRFFFDVCIDVFHWRKTSQLPMAVPFVQKLLTPHVDWMKHRHLHLGILVVFLIISGVIVVQRGKRMLGTEFRGGTEVELRLRTDPASHSPMTMTRQQVQDRLKEIVKENHTLSLLAEAEILPVNPRSDGVTSDHFRIRTAPGDEKLILGAITRRFEDVTESSSALSFDGSNTADSAPYVFPLLTQPLKDNIDRTFATGDAGPFLGGAAIVVENLDPRPTRDELQKRLENMRRTPRYADTLSRTRELRVVAGTEDAVQSAVILVGDEEVSAIDNLDEWKRDLAGSEWGLVNDALATTTQLASVRSFSPMIAATFATHAILSVVVSLIALTIYVWIRFGAARWAVAATVPLFADCIGIAGMIGLAEVLYDSPTMGNTARVMGLLPFKFDLAQIAALLTIIGYSLNDKIIILDRIRENKGKVKFASYQCINDSINQTLSRTLITAGGHLITTVILYFYGGEAVRGFAFAFNLGVILGTYTSIVSSPLVWSHEEEKAHAEALKNA